MLTDCLTDAQADAPFLKLTSPLVIAKPPPPPTPPPSASPIVAPPAALTAAGASESVGGSAHGGAGSAPSAAPTGEAAVAAAKKAADAERLRELKDKHDREVAAREESERAERKRIADEQKRAADERKRAADEQARVQHEEEQRRKQKTNALFSGLLGAKPPVSAFEDDDADPFPATKEQLKQMGNTSALSPFAPHALCAHFAILSLPFAFASLRSRTRSACRGQTVRCQRGSHCRFD